MRAVMVVVMMALSPFSVFVSLSVSGVGGVGAGARSL